jgi:hypothetical protein
MLLAIIFVVVGHIVRVLMYLMLPLYFVLALWWKNSCSLWWQLKPADVEKDLLEGVSA